MNAPQRKIPAPPVSPETEAFWSAVRDGKLLLRKCLACGEVHYYPRSICPFCFSDRTEWRPASGRGTLYSFSVMRRAPEPYCIAYVTLEEGPTIMTNIVDCDFDTLHISQKLRLVFVPSDGGPPVPMFTPQ